MYDMVKYMSALMSVQNTNDNVEEVLKGREPAWHVARERITIKCMSETNRIRITLMDRNYTVAH